MKQIRPQIVGAFALASTCALASAQETRVFLVDEASSPLVEWTATSNLGPMGAFLQSYGFSGDIAVDFDQNPNFGAARITGARLRVPNSVVAAVQSGPGGVVFWRDLVLDAKSADFNILPTFPFPTFSTTIELSVSSGFLQIEPPFGPATSTPINGMDLGSIAVSGSFPSIGPMQAMWLDEFSFDMDFDAPGFNGTFTHEVEQLRLRGACPEPVSYCPGGPLPGPGPFGAILSIDGSTSVAADDFTLQVTSAPNSTFGLFFYGPTAAQVPNGAGLLCVGGPLTRLPIILTDPAGSGALTLPLADYQNVPAPLSAGSHHCFQFWHRQLLPAGQTWNFSSAVAVTFCP